MVGEPHIGEQDSRKRRRVTARTIVTGASSGLGKEFVKHIDAGASGQIDEIWVVARRLERLKALQRTCGTPVRPFGLDLAYSLLTDPTELALARKISELEDLIAGCARDRAPFRLTHYAEELAPGVMRALAYETREESRTACLKK